MMNFLILYGTTEGQTRKIAGFVGERVRERGHTTTVMDATDGEAGYLRLSDFDGVIIAASLHLGFYQAAIEDFVRRHHATLNGMRTVFLSVSLAAASKDPEDRKGMESCVQRFLTATSWKPGEVHHVIGAFRYTQYDFFKRWGMKLIAREKGIATSQDLELTDWIDLASLVDVYVATLMKAKRIKPEPLA
jgi:menaquinone-dependent protoporphyrinogen oxidase